MIVHGDCIEAMAAMDAVSVDAIVTDPPYGLEFMGKEWDRLGALTEPVTDTENRDGNWTTKPFGGGGQRVRYGSSVATMQAWHEAWAREALRVLKPGGHLLAFGGTRTYHRLTCAIEDAGFEIRDCIAWMYGSGFPKSLDVSKAIDKAAGAEREVVVGGSDGAARKPRAMAPGGAIREAVQTLSTPATPDAERWQGWGTALKPAWESIVCAVKPDPETEREAVEWSLCLLGNRLAALSPANSAVSRSTSSPVEHDAALLASARWTAGERASTRGALCAAMDTSQFESAISTSLSIVSSWRRTLADLCEPTSTSTTATNSSTTTVLRTLNSCSSGLTPRIIIEALTHPDGSRLDALPAAQAFNAVALNLSATRSLSAIASATERERIERRDEDAQPLLEPVVVARKPLNGTVAATVLAHGTGALNVDGCRVSMTAEDADFIRKTARPNTAGQMHDGAVMNRPGAPTVNVHDAGRWPANVVLSHSPGCREVGTRKVKPIGATAYRAEHGKGQMLNRGEGVAAHPGYRDADGTETIPAWECVEDCPVRALDAQSGGVGAHPVGRADGDYAYAQRGQVPSDAPFAYSDSGGASRFFATFPADMTRFRYQSKADTAERNAGLGDRGASLFAPHACICETNTEWVNEDQRAVTPADSVTPPPRVTTAPTSEADSAWSTTGPGSKPTAPSPTASRSTTSTATSKTTTSPTSSSSTTSLTSDSTVPTTDSTPAARGNGVATSAESGNQPTPSTTTSTPEDGSSTADADPATSRSSSELSRSAGSVCASCGGVIGGARRNDHPT